MAFERRTHFCDGNHFLLVTFVSFARQESQFALVVGIAIGSFVTTAGAVVGAAFFRWLVAAEESAPSGPFLLLVGRLYRRRRYFTLAAGVRIFHIPLVLEARTVPNRTFVDRLLLRMLIISKDVMESSGVPG